MLIGRFTAKNPKIDGQDLRIQIDQHLLTCNLPILGVDDNELLQQCLDEVIISVLGSGFNRKQRRSV